MEFKKWISARYGSFKPKSKILQLLFEPPRGNYLEKGSGSDLIDEIFTLDVVDVLESLGYEKAGYLNAKEVAEWRKDQELAQEEIKRETQRSLKERGFPEVFEVYRGGEVRGEYVPVTIHPHTARFHAKRHGNKGVFNAFLIRREDVVADIDLFQRGYDEGELLIHRTNLTHSG